MSCASVIEFCLCLACSLINLSDVFRPLRSAAGTGGAFGTGSGPLNPRPSRCVSKGRCCKNKRVVCSVSSGAIVCPSLVDADTHVRSPLGSWDVSVSFAIMFLWVVSSWRARASLSRLFFPPFPFAPTGRSPRGHRGIKYQPVGPSLFLYTRTPKTNHPTPEYVFLV